MVSLLTVVASITTAAPHTRLVRPSTTAAVRVAPQHSLSTQRGRHPRRRQRRCPSRSGGWHHHRLRGRLRQRLQCDHARCHPTVRAPLVLPYPPRAHTRPWCRRHHHRRHAVGRLLLSGGLWWMHRRWVSPLPGSHCRQWQQQRKQPLPARAVHSLCSCRAQQACEAVP